MTSSIWCRVPVAVNEEVAVRTDNVLFSVLISCNLLSFGSLKNLYTHLKEFLTLLLNVI